MDIWFGMSSLSLSLLLQVFRFISRQVDYGGLLLGKTLLNKIMLIITYISIK